MVRATPTKAERRRLWLLILGGLGAAAVAAWLAFAPTQPPALIARGPTDSGTRPVGEPAFVASGAASPTASSAQVPSMDAGDEAAQLARRIINDARAAYAACATYEIDGTMCDRIEGVERHSDGTPRVHVRLWIARDDGLIRRRVEDDIWNEDDARQVQMASGDIESATLGLREAGMSEDVVKAVRERMQKIDPLSTFAIATYHPRCNEPVVPGSLRATDGSL